jgi:hypothetical protein
MKVLQNYPGQYRNHQRRRAQQGQSLVEFAMIVPMLFIFLILMSILAQGFNLQMVLLGAAYEGARIWARNPVTGGDAHCSPPACNPSSGNQVNFERYVEPVVRQYLTDNGFDGSLLHFYSPDKGRSREAVRRVGNQADKVDITLIYPYRLPVGVFITNYQEWQVTATITMKRGG